MNKFLKKTSLFGFILVGYFLVNLTLNAWFSKNINSEQKEVNVLILGDSHTQKSLNPSFFISAKNISQPGEPYILSFWKLKNLYKKLKPDTIIIGVAHHNFSSYQDLKFSHSKWAKEMFKRSYIIEEFEKVENQINIDYSAYYFQLFKQFCFLPKVNHHLYIGSYSNKKINNPNDWKSAIKRHYFFEGSIPKVSQTSIQYLDSIITFCQNHNITTIAVSNPLHPSYKSNIPPIMKSNYLGVLKNISNNKVLVINKSLKPFPESYFYNCDHLNALGAESFTKSVLKEIH